MLNPGTGADGPRQLGFFPDDSIERIRRIQSLKADGYSMAEIVEQMGVAPEANEAVQGSQSLHPIVATSDAPAAAAGAESAAAPRSAIPPAVAGRVEPPWGRGELPATGPLRVTIEDIAYPAYMVNHSFELCWVNDAARNEVFCGLPKLPPTSEGRSLFRLLAAGGVDSDMAELLRFHVRLAKTRLTPNSFADGCHGVSNDAFAWLQRAYAEAEPQAVEPIFDALISLGDDVRRAYVSVFREGIFFVLTPQDHESDTMLDFLARRDEVIRGLLQRRMPVLTHLAVLVADLQGSVRICAELPPDEYFALINEIWAAMAPIFRRYHGTHGKHVGDGMVYYFFQQPDSNYLYNALACATEMREEMKRISMRWHLNKNWFNDLFLNTGITEGQEWLGTFRSNTSIEFVVLGDTINQAARISDFARGGSIWATKSLIGKLPPESREHVCYGVRRPGDTSGEIFIPSSFATVSSLVKSSDDASCKLRDIATLPIAEVVDVTAQRAPCGIS